MIKIFNGKMRGPGANGRQLGAIIDFTFREYIHYFKGANLHIFMAICLHSDEEGYCFPSYDTLERETGYGRATIAKAIKDLCDLKIDGFYVLAKWRKRDEKGRFTGSNRYRIFPSPEELQELETDVQSSESPEFRNSNCGQDELEDKPLKEKDNPIDSSSDDEAAPTGDKPSVPTPVSKKTKAKIEPKPKQDNAAEKVPTEHQEMFGALCKLVGWDYAVITKEQAGQVAQTLGVLKKGNYTIEDLRKFYLYWRDKDWRGQKGQYPTLSLVRSEIGKIRLNGNGHGNGHIAPALAVFTGSEK